MATTRKADRPRSEAGRQYHLDLAPGELGPTVLLPGDPFRVSTLTEPWEDVEEVAHHREYHSMRGTYRGVPVAACSTGIGGPSTEIAINELAEIGCNTFIRLGTAGGLQEHIRVGDVIISTGAIRWDGATASYAPAEYPAIANYEVVLALAQACERLHRRYHVGVTASVASFYAAQGRPAFGNYRGLHPERTERLRELGILNFEMESGTLFTLTSLFGLRAGTACLVIADRFRNEFETEGADYTLAAIGGEATVILSQMDVQKEETGHKWYVPRMRPGQR